MRARAAEAPHIVEAINWTVSESGEVHYNRYFARDLDEAMGLAVRLRIGFEEGVEEVVAIRPATKAEAERGGKASAHFLELMPLAISHLNHEEVPSKGEADLSTPSACPAGRPHLLGGDGPPDAVVFELVRGQKEGRCPSFSR